MKKIRKTMALLMSVSVLFGILLNSSISAYAVSLKRIEEGVYVLCSKLSNDMVMDVDNASVQSGANIQLWKYNGSSAQQFTVKKSGDWYTIHPVCSGLALDVKGGSTASGANVQQYKINNTDSQKWQFYDAGNGYYYLRSKVGNKALDVSGGKSQNGANIQVYNPSNNNSAQQWELKKVSVLNQKSLADTALKELGYQGTKKNGKGKGDYTKYGKWIKCDGQPWCAAFVSWCVNKSGVSTKIVPKTASCTSMKNSSNSYKSWSSSALKNIKKNDVIFFADTQKSSKSFHVGIVYSISGSKITVIEGNTGDYYGPDTVAKITYTVDPSSGKITKGYNGKYFCGYISVH